MVTLFYSHVRRCLTCVLVLTLMACGGGSGTDGTGAVAASQAHSVAESQAHSVAESIPNISAASEASVKSIAPSVPSSSYSSSLSSSLSSSSLSSSSTVFAPNSIFASSSSYATVKSLRLSVPKQELIVGEQVDITAKAYYDDGREVANPSVWWDSGNSNVIQLRGNTLSAVGVGTAMAYGEIGGTATSSLFITVKEAPSVLQAIHIDFGQSGSLMMGSVRRLKVMGDYLNTESIVIANIGVKFTSTDWRVASLNDRGEIVPHVVGKATITASYQGKTATYQIEVVPLDVVFHILKPASWQSAMHAHWFSPEIGGLAAEKSSTFPGSAMQDLDNDGWYDLTLNYVKDIKIMFNDGDAGSRQTTDQFVRNGGWFVPDEFANAEGKYYGTWYDTKPVLPQQEICDVKDFGAKGDGLSKDTVAIQKAIDTCADKNGIVRLRDGKFVSGSLMLKSDMTLRIEPTATLLGSRDTADYPDLPILSGNNQYSNCRKALIYLEKVSNIRIDGGGTIDGNGGTGSPWMTGLEAARPMAIFLAQTRGITLQNITVKNAAMWAVVPFESADITIRGLSVDSLAGQNLKGINIVDSRNLLLEAVDINSQDDAISLSSGSADLGVHNVLVRYSKVKGSKLGNGLKLGAASVGPLQHITFDNISLRDVARGGIVVASVDGSAIFDIKYRNITMDKVGTPFYVALGNRSKNKNSEQRVGSINELTFDTITATNITETWGSYISGVTSGGVTYPLTNLWFQDVNLNFPGGSTNVGTPWEFNADYSGEYPDPGPSNGTANKKDMPGYLYFRHLHNVILYNTKVSVAPVDQRPKVVTEDVSRYTADPL